MDDYNDPTGGLPPDLDGEVGEEDFSLEDALDEAELGLDDDEKDW